MMTDTTCTDEIRRLQGFVGDLTSIQALPAIWSGQDSAHILGTLLDELMRVLQLDFAFARLSDSISGPPVEFARLAQRLPPSWCPEDIGRLLDPLLTGSSAAASLTVPNPMGEGEVTLVPIRLGLQDEIGLLVAGSKRPDFPTQIEALLLRVAADQAIVALREEGQLHEQTRAAAQLERHIAERSETLRASEERFRSYFELGLVGMAITSPTKDILEVNDEICRILGYERNELLQKTWAEMTHPDDLAADVTQFNLVMAGEIDGYTMDKRWVCKQGHAIDSIVAAKCQRRHDGSVDYFVKLVLDTTDRKRAEADLRRSEANLTEGQRLSHTGSWSWNVSSGGMFCSQELLRIFGLDHLTVPPMHESFMQVIHPEDQERTRRLFDEATRNQTDYEADYRIVLGDGSIRHIRNLGHPVFNDLGKLAEYVGTTIDTTERIEAEESVRKAHEHLELILASISDQFFGLSKDWRFTFFNQHAAAQMRLLGKDPQELIGKVLWEVFPEVPNEAALRRVMSERVAITDELYYAPLGEWVENHMYPSDDGGLVTFQRYVTSRKRTEEELLNTQAQLAHVSRVTMMGELAATIAHEINQPLGAIVNNGNACLRLLADQLASNQDACNALLDIVHDAERASAIITRVRALTRRTVPERISLQLRDVIADVLALAHRELAGQRIEVRTDLPEELPRVWGDRVLLQQVFLNLVINGLETMSAVSDERRVLTIRGEQDELLCQPAVRITVQDLGGGIAPAAVARVFEAFYTTKSQGLGMGLRICASIVEGHGGRLWVTPNDGPGVTFSCSLPLESPGTL